MYTSQTQWCYESQYFYFDNLYHSCCPYDNALYVKNVHITCFHLTNLKITIDKKCYQLFGFEGFSSALSHKTFLPRATYHDYCCKVVKLAKCTVQSSPPSCWNRTEANRHEFLTSKTKYNKIKRTAKYKYKQLEGERLTNLAKVKPREFWKVIKKHYKKKSPFVKHINGSRYIHSL